MTRLESVVRLKSLLLLGFILGVPLASSAAQQYQQQQQQQQQPLQQFFRTKPRDAEVSEGGSVVVKCEVANRQGRVQWTKDGLTLGYDRQLPGFPRYTVLGDDSSGEFSLNIVEATLGDDAVYECQVGPAPYNKPIRASARLTVLLPPTKIELAGVHSGTRLEVRENEEVELRCVVHDARPKARIVWYRQNAEFHTENRQDEDTPSPLGHERVTSSSALRFRPTNGDNGVTWACEADHAAIALSPLRASVLVSVLHPPGPPEISGYIEGETIRLGQTVTLVCTATGGNPLAQISWFRNGVKVDKSYTTSGRESRNTYTFMASADDDNAKFVCESQNQLSAQPMTAEIVLSVQFAPESIELLGPTEARAGEILSYSCVTSNSNPPATIQWVVGNATKKAEHTETVTSPLGGWITRANVTVSLGQSDRSKMVVCKAINSELNDIKSESKMLSVIYPPGAPQIIGLTEGEVLTAGSLRRVTCTSVSGNPLATLTWHLGEEVRKDAQYFTKDNYATSELSLWPKSADNGKELKCEAASVASPESSVISVGVLRVNFPPESVKIRMKPDRPRAGQNVTLICETASSNPAATIVWWHNGERINGAEESLVTEGDFGGKVTSSQLPLALSAQHNDAVVTCEAANEIAGKRVHDAITLSVNHKPVFVPSSSKPYSLVEGKSALINMTAVANPSTVSYQWTRSSDEETELKIMEGNRVRVHEGILNISHVRREDAGYYTIRANNEEGATQTKIRLDVLYPPRIMDITSSVLVGEGEPAHFECAVDANPLRPQETIRWERVGEGDSSYDMDAKTKTTEGSPSTNGTNVGVVLLTVINATADDSGAFACVADNGIGGGKVKNITMLYVRHKPVIKKSALTSKSAADLGETARLVCEARGVPNVTFGWLRVGGGQHIKPEDRRYQLSGRPIDPLTWLSEILVMNVSNEDYGQYECVARNSEGSTRHRVSLDVKSRPDPPSALSVFNSTHNSAVLSWSPGFPGGMDQYFRIRYSINGGGSPRYFDVYPANAQQALLQGLQPGRQYSADVMAFNNIGESNYTSLPVSFKTLVKPVEESNGELMMREVMEGKGEIPFIVIVSVSVAGTLLLLLNIVLISVFVHKKRRGTNGGKAEGGGGGGSSGEGTPSSEGSTSTGSTKSANMELYTTSSYNETMSGETMSSISEKSCISNNNGGAMATTALNGHHMHLQQQHHRHHREDYGSAYMEDHLHPHALSTYLVDPPLPRSATLDQLQQQQQIYNTSIDGGRRGSASNLISPYIHRHLPSELSNEEDNSQQQQVMALYSVVNKQHRHHQPQSSGGEEDENNYEDTESEYAVELRRQAYMHAIGEHGGYGNLIGMPPPGSCTSSVYSTLPPPPPPLLLHLPMSYQQQLQHCNNGGTSSPVAMVEGPLCASSPKRCVSAFTTFGQPQQVVKSTPTPTSGHLV